MMNAQTLEGQTWTGPRFVTRWDGTRYGTFDNRFKAYIRTGFLYPENRKSECDAQTANRNAG